MAMTEEAKEARRVYLRQWARDNRDKCRVNQERYWQRIADRMAAEKAKEGARDES